MTTTLGEVFNEKGEFASPCGVESAKPGLLRGVSPAAPPLIDESSTLKVVRPHFSSCRLALSGCMPSRFYTCKGEFLTDFKNVNRPDWAVAGCHPQSRLKVVTNLTDFRSSTSDSFEQPSFVSDNVSVCDSSAGSVQVDSPLFFQQSLQWSCKLRGRLKWTMQLRRGMWPSKCRVRPVIETHTS